MITVKELTKRYGAHTAVDALSFTVDRAKSTACLGRTAQANPRR
ncbi:MAG: hypothetical protein ACLVJ8_03045 [Ruthenibacterium lactatiformans]